MNSYGKLLSIVVPVYKVEPYIGKCLDSLILDDERLMDLLEVIIVNDGTPDRSAEMSREYVKRYPATFRQIDKENGGHGSAWNVGLKEATGKYLRFLDSDDWLTNLDRFLSMLSSCEADLVLTRVNRYCETTGKSDFSYQLPASGQQYSVADFPEILPEPDLMANFWYSTYRTDILKPLYPLFLEGVYYDDSVLYLVPLLYGKTFVCQNLVLYNYRLERVGQTMNYAIQLEHIPDRFKVYRQMSEFIAQNGKSVPPNLSELFGKIMEQRRKVLFNLIAEVSPYRKNIRLVKDLKALGDTYNMAFHTKMYERYKRFPYPVFYAGERLRRLKRKVFD